MKQGSRRATNAVFRNLQHDAGHMTLVWERCMSADTSAEDFTEAAKRYLLDRSELATRTIEVADWAEIYAHFRAELAQG